MLGHQSGLVGINRGCDGDDNEYYGDCSGDGDDDADFFHALSMKRIIIHPRDPDEAVSAAACVGSKVGHCARLPIAQLPAEELGSRGGRPQVLRRR